VPLVFVHGVKTRDSAAYQRSVTQQRNMFARVALRGLAEDLHVSHPYWGDLAARPAWENASVPDGDFESFGADDQVALVVGEAVDGWADDNPLLSLARTDFLASLDLLWTLVPEARASSDLAELGAKAVAYADVNPVPPWLSDVNNDAQFLTRLAVEIDEWQPVATDAAHPEPWESFGLSDAWDGIREAAGRLVGLPGRAAGSAVLAVTRSKLHNVLSLFIGDVLVYLNTRGTSDNPGPIPELVIRALQDAEGRRTDQDPFLVAVGHSMGGNILYDVLTHYLTNTRVDALVTVGSQVSVFEELKLFHASDARIPSNTEPTVAAPVNIGRWINVFDRQDILSFVGRKVFGAVEDFEYSTGASVVGAHSSYFARPSFHKRLNERLTEALLR
jgi:hypothetical protein